MGSLRHESTQRVIVGVAIAVMCALPVHAAPQGRKAQDLKLLPYPQEVRLTGGTLPFGPAQRVTHGAVTAMQRTAIESLNSYLPRKGNAVRARLGSAESGYPKSWLSASQRLFLTTHDTSPEAYVLRITRDGITVVGKGQIGMLYGVQTVNQLALQAVRNKENRLPCLTIRDWPDMKWRCLSPTMTWYSGYNRLEGYDLCNWTLDEWKWLADWSLLHKCNGWAMCMYGYWPFTLPGHESNTLDVDSFFFNPATGRKESRRFSHRNIRQEFLPELIRYANQRGIKVYAYIGKNSFNGTYCLTNPEMNGGGAAELLPFAPGVKEYWDAFIKRIVEIGFDGFVFEDPEARHVPNQNERCYQTFWEPWAKTYGFTSVADTDQNNPPLGVHVEYYTWLFRQFDEMIQRHARRLGRNPEIYLISHILLSRVVSESKTKAERDTWFAYIDRKHGRKVPFVILEADESKYVGYLGRDRVASLGGRGGSCTCAMRRIAGVNNDWSGGGMGAGVDYERDCQRRIFEAGGFGAMGYIFEWTNTEVFGYIASQYLWRNSGVPGINNHDQAGFLDYAYRLHYGDEVGHLVARAMDESSCVNDAMVLEGVHGAQYPETGRPLHRDYQLLAALADHGVELATRAYRRYTGRNPDLYHPVYRPEEFRWRGFDAAADRRFKAERLRLLCVSQARSRQMCEAALAHRKAERLMAEGASIGAVLDELDRAIAAAKANQLLYQVNYDDDYDWTDGLCVKVTERLESIRNQFVATCAARAKAVKSWSFDKPGELWGWAAASDLTAPVVEDGALVAQATGNDPILVQTESLAIPVSRHSLLEIEMTSDMAGTLQVFWTTDGSDHFSEAQSQQLDIPAGSAMTVYRLAPAWEGTLTRLRIDPPNSAKVRIRSIRIVEIPQTEGDAGLDRDRTVPESLRRWPANPLFIAWEKLSDVVPAERTARKPGLYLSTDLGLDAKPDYYRLGVVFTVQAKARDGGWKTLFRRNVNRRVTGWEHWEIPLGDTGGKAGSITLRLVTDSYSRAQDRDAPSWRWALWGQPKLIRVAADGKRRAIYDFTANIERARPSVLLDRESKERPFDGKGEDSTGATFRRVGAGPVVRLQSGEGKAWQWVDGYAEWLTPPPYQGPYRSYLGIENSGWAYARDQGEVSWLTSPVPKAGPTAVAFIGGTGYGAGTAELWCEGKRLLDFDMAKPMDMRWREDGVELRYLHGGDTRDEKTTFGISGVYVLRLPASMVTPGKPLRLRVTLGTGSGDWFMVHGYRNIAQVTREALSPDPDMPTIAAFTPHLDGAFGVTIAEYAVAVGR